MNHMLIVREAKDTDAPVIAELYRTLVSDPHIAVLPERLRSIAENPQTFLLVCELDGAVCGTALVSLCLDAMYGHQPYAVIENIVVAEERRRLGVGRSLFVHIEELCGSHDCSKMILLSGEARADAHRFFTRRGFKAAKRGFVKYRRDFQRVVRPPDSSDSKFTNP
jgi:N-acetylglutamate synthase-like GNAT family acetyltransferase